MKGGWEERLLSTLTVVLPFSFESTQSVSSLLQRVARPSICCMLAVMDSYNKAWVC